MTSHYRAVFAPSQELAMATGREDVIVLSNGVDTRTFHPLKTEQRPNLRRDLGWGPEETVFFVPRRWAPNKGVLVAATALSFLGHRALRFVFAGSASTQYVDYAARVSEALSVAPVPYDVLGHLNYDDLVPYFQAADFVLIPSIREATSLAALEAMACGTPVIASATGGLLELIVHRETGFLCTPASPVALANVIDDVLRLDSSTLADVARRAINVAHSYEFSWSHVVDTLECHYDEALRASR